MRLLEREDELAALEDVLREGGVLMVEGGSGIGKTSLLAAAAEGAAALGHELVRARGSELEAGFAFGVVRQLFERRLALASADERRALLAGPASAAKPVLAGKPVEGAAADTSFAVVHGLYWLAANFAAAQPLVITVDDAHWADLVSLRFLAYLAPRVEGLALSLLIALRPSRPAEEPAPLAAIRAEATVLRPRLLSEGAATDLVQSTAGIEVSGELCTALWRTSGGNPFYLTELLRGVEPSETPMENVRDGVTRHVAARIRRLDRDALRLAQSLAVLGDGSELRHGAALAGLGFEAGTRLAAGLVQLEILAADTPPRFLHPIVRDSVEYSLTQRLIGREAAAGGSSREVASFSLTQSVSLGRPFTSATAGGLSGSTVPQQGRFTPLIAGLHVNPYQSITLDAAATFGNVSHQLDQTSLSANLMGTGAIADKYLSFTWFSSFRPPAVNGVPSTNPGSSQFRINSGSSLLSNRIRADVQINYDAKQGKFLEQRYLIGGTASCYGLALEYRRYIVYTPKEHTEPSYGISISLKNIGAVAVH